MVLLISRKIAAPPTHPIPLYSSGAQPIYVQTLWAKLGSSFPVLRLNIFSCATPVCETCAASSSMKPFLLCVGFLQIGPVPPLQMPALEIEWRDMRNLGRSKNLLDRCSTLSRWETLPRIIVWVSLCLAHSCMQIYCTSTCMSPHLSDI